MNTSSFHPQIMTTSKRKKPPLSKVARYHNAAAKQLGRDHDLNEKGPFSFEEQGARANALFLQNGPSLAVIKEGLRQHQFPTDNALASAGTRFARIIDNALQKHIALSLGSMPDTQQETAPSANQYQTERRNLILRSRDAIASQVWARAVQIVKTEPDRALAILEQDVELGSRAVMKASGLLTPTTGKGPEYYYAQMHLIGIQITARLRHEFDDPNEIDPDQLILIAVEMWGGMHLLKTVAIAFSMVSALGILTEIAINRMPPDMDRRTIDGRLPIVGEDAAGLELWGMYHGIVNIIAKEPVSLWHHIAYGFVTANRITDEIHANAKSTEQQVNRAIRAAERDTQRLSKRLHDTEVQLASVRRKLEVARANSVAPSIGTASGDSAADESTQLRRTIERLRQELEDKSATLDGVQELLDAVLSDPAAPEETKPLTSNDVKTLRGVIIGGHPVLLNKLRKILPNCTFYSADQKRIDDTNLIESQFVIFNTGYCNHALADNALRLCRRHDIPTGYSTHVNPERFLEDLAKTIGRGG